jgi:tetratricopeptide (TPR) repeat protein
MALVNKGRVLSQLHKFDEAISNYDRVLKIDSNNTDALINEAFSLSSLGKKADSLSYLDTYLLYRFTILIKTSVFIIRFNIIFRRNFSFCNCYIHYFIDSCISFPQRDFTLQSFEYIFSVF